MHFSRAYDRWWAHEVILSIGGKTYTRQTCVRELGCPNFRAAQNLSTALQSIGVDSTKALAKITPADLLRLEGVGERTVFVALCVLDTSTANGTAERWLHSDETKPSGKSPTAPPPKPKVSAAQQNRAKHPRPGSPARATG